MEIDTAKCFKNQENAEQESEVSNAVDNKRFLSSISGDPGLEVVADQEVGTESDSFPTHEHEKVVVCEHKDAHHENEQVHISKESVVARFSCHVPN